MVAVQYQLQPHPPFPLALHLPHILFLATLLNGSTMFALRRISGGPKTPVNENYTILNLKEYSDVTDDNHGDLAGTVFL